MAELDARLTRLESSYEALEEALALPSPTTPADNGVGSLGKEPLSPNLEAWVAGWFALTFARRLGTTRWCAQWWLHAEAIVRLEALWRSWETLRLDPNLGIATWLRDHLDPQRAVLMGDTGPFQACDGGEHNPPPELPVIPAPAGYWPNRVSTGEGGRMNEQHHGNVLGGAIGETTQTAAQLATIAATAAQTVTRMRARRLARAAYGWRRLGLPRSCGLGRDE